MKTSRKLWLAGAHTPALELAVASRAELLKEEQELFYRFLCPTRTSTRQRGADISHHSFGGPMQGATWSPAGRRLGKNFVGFAAAAFFALGAIHAAA
jgi:hypothetical protein